MLETTLGLEYSSFIINKLKRYKLEFKQLGD